MQVLLLLSVQLHVLLLAPNPTCCMLAFSRGQIVITCNKKVVEGQRDSQQLGLALKVSKVVHGLVQQGLLRRSRSKHKQYLSHLA